MTQDEVAMKRAFREWCVRCNMKTDINPLTRDYVDLNTNARWIGFQAGWREHCNRVVASAA